MELLYLLITFLAGGGIIAGVTYLTQAAGPRFAGILAVAPIVTTLSFLFASFGTSQERTQGLVLASLIFLIPTILFLACLYLLMYRYSLFVSLAGAYGIWAITVLGVARLTGMI
jgi:uncharacterized membrane protein (GlpM family)